MTTVDTATLHALFHYDPLTGIFTSKRGRRVGRAAGCRDMSKRGYVRLSIPVGNGRYIQIYAHRAAWQYVYGSEPDIDVDHRNGVRWDNRLENLRLADRNQNQWNYPTPKTNTTGAKGVRLCATTGKYRAQIRHFNKRIYLGSFDTIEAAAQAYNQKAAELFGEFMRQETANDNVNLSSEAA